MLNRASQLRTISAGSPAPSFPISRAAGDFQSASQGRAIGGTPSRVTSPSGTAAYAYTPETRNRDSRAAQSAPCNIGNRSDEPAEARSAFGPSGFAVPNAPDG